MDFKLAALLITIEVSLNNLYKAVRRQIEVI